MGNKPRLAEELVAEIKAMLAEGFKQTHVAQRHNVSRSTVQVIAADQYKFKTPAYDDVKQDPKTIVERARMELARNGRQKYVES